MVLTTGIAIVVMIALLLVGSQVASNFYTSMVVQTVLIGIAAGAMVMLNAIAIPLAIGMTITPGITHVLALLWFRWMAHRIRNGAYGEESQWAAELADDGDEEFINAAMNLNQVEMREAGIVSDTKEELRETVIERGSEQDDDQND